MIKTKTIKLKNLGIVSIEMDPKNPKTKFDKKLKDVIPAGEIYQLAMFNDDNTKFRLIEDIAKHKQDVYEINKTTCSCKFFDELSKKGTASCIKYPNGFQTWTLIEHLNDNFLKNTENNISLDYLLENNKTFVLAQTKMRKHIIDKKEFNEILNANF